MGHLAVPATAPPPSVVPSSPRGFVAFDDRVVSAHAGLVVVRAPDVAHGGLLAHAARRLQTSGFDPVVVTGTARASVVREVGLQLGVRCARHGEPAEIAEAIATAADDARAVLLLELPEPGTWDGVVIHALARAGNVLVVGVAAEPAKTWLDEATDSFDLGAALRGPERLRWLGAIAEEAQHEHPSEALDVLEAWWRRARDEATREDVHRAALGGDAEDLFVGLVLVGRSAPLARVDERAARELVSSGLARLRGGRLLATSTVVAGGEPVSPEVATPAQRAIANELLSIEHGDAWDDLRRAELALLDAQGDADLDRADALARRALESNLDPRVASLLAERWFDAVSAITGAPGLVLRRRGAERALSVGDAHGARRWCESASAIAEADPETELLRGRALVLAGDLVAARVALQRVAKSAADPELSARVAVELASLALVSGKHEDATREAKRAGQLAKTASTRLAARNVVGKVLLAQARWDDADAHFAEDAMLSIAASDDVAHMRSSVNRAIAVLSKGRLDDARGMLDSVLSEAERRGEHIAAAFALSNLAIIALRQQDYGRALACWEEAVQRGQGLRGRVGVAQSLANLAELRLRLGLVEHAEHAVAFGRRLLAGGDATAIKAHFRRVAAEIAMVRRRMDVARSEIEAALGDALAAGNAEVLQQVWLVDARVALEEGDLARAAEAIRRAAEIPTNERNRAELAILRAREERARGLDARARALEAVASATEARSRHFAIEAHVLAARAHLAAEDLDAANEHMDRARAVCDQVAASLPEDLKRTFLARSHVAALCREHVGLFPGTVAAEVVAPAPATVTPGGRRIVGQDPQVRTLLNAIRKVARSNSTVLVRGESGTGKELVAEEIHRQSPRGSGPLVSVNCAALVETLLLSELFGHERGAFTGASARRRGRFEMAEGGTLFLDEIGDVSPKTQVALLRVLQERTFERVGGTSSIRADVRVVCATHRDLRKMVDRGEFREDLYYRLAEITLDVPALRSRLGDLPEIAEHLLERIALERGEPRKAIGHAALALMARHGWPGNVRELENVLRAASLFAEGEAIAEADLVENVEDLRLLAAAEARRSRDTLRPPELVSVESAPSSAANDDDGGALPEGEATATAVAYAQVRRGSIGLSDLKRQIERDCIVRALGETRGNITKAAALLGMKRPRLSQLAKAYGITGSSEAS